MWVVYYIVVLYWFLMEKLFMFNLVLVNNGGGLCNFLGGLCFSYWSNGVMVRKFGNFVLLLMMIVFDRNRIISCSDVMFYGNF